MQLHLAKNIANFNKQKGCESKLPGVVMSDCPSSSFSPWRIHKDEQLATETFEYNQYNPLCWVERSTSHNRPTWSYDMLYDMTACVRQKIPTFVRQLSTQTRTMLNITKRRCKLKEAERIALQRLDVFEAKQVYKNNAEYKKACRLKEAERIALHKTRCLWAKHVHTTLNITRLVMN